MSRGSRLGTAIALVAVVTGLGGCGRYYWSKPGGTLDDFNKDSAACVKQTSPQPGLVLEENYRVCLKERGWQRTQEMGASDTRFRGIE